ncbi:uncharacterized protein LOC127082325 [Lathyrus oleraceus]|uniref:uncharacterized protein LOC127082325 n=1 Tax=Pisum sativum TaxID=3888 RepID=UPI0021D30FD3|nr:uncharacterized protein LOC127082325 [Pisum sativum]
MPSYAKFIKEIISNENKLEDNETVTLTAKCNTFIQNNMPHKLEDPDSLSIPCVIEKYARKYSHTNWSILYSHKLHNTGIKEYSNIPIILGRPFLATIGAIIDVKQGKLTFEALAIDDTCCFIDIIDKYVKEMEIEPLKDTEILKIMAPPIIEDDE